MHGKAHCLAPHKDRTSVSSADCASSASARILESRSTLLEGFTLRKAAILWLAGAMELALAWHAAGPHRAGWECIVICMLRWYGNSWFLMGGGMLQRLPEGCLLTGMETIHRGRWPPAPVVISSDCI